MIVKDDFVADDFQPDGGDDFVADDFAPDQPMAGARDIVGAVARPLLEGGGAIAGGVIGAPLGPVGAVGGGAVGFGLGKSTADLLDRGLGRMKPLSNLKEAVVESGNNLYQGAMLEATGLGASKIIPPILKSSGKLRNLAGEWATGIPSKDFQTLADNPMAMRPGTLTRAGEKFDAAAKGAGISSELTTESVDRIRHPGQYAFDTFKKLKTAGRITPQEALHARQSIDAIYPIPNKKNGSYIRTLDQIRDAFQDVIASASPALKEASKDYAIGKSGSRFQAVLPQNKSGTPSFFRGGAMIAGLLSGNPSAAFMSPAVAGTATAATGAVGKGFKSVLRNAPGRRMLIGGASSLLRPKPESDPRIVNPSNNVPQSLNGRANGGNQKKGVENGPRNFSQVTPKRLFKPKVEKKLQKADAEQYLRKAKGDKQLARRMALSDGWSLV